MSALTSESGAVQEPILRYAQEVGWRLLDPKSAISDRGGESGLFLFKTLRAKILELNPGVISEENIDEVVQRIESSRSTIEGNRDILEWIRGRRTVFVEAEKRHVPIRTIDFEHPSANVFHVTREWQYTNGRYTNRADVVFCINGIPIAIVETKAATKVDGVEKGGNE